MDPGRERDAEAFPSHPDDIWSGHDHKGWNRASIRFWSRSDPGPPVRPEDLLLPSGLGNLRMLGSCAAMAGIATILYVWVPAMLVNVFVAIGGRLMLIILLGAFVTLTLGLFFWGTVETHRDRELAGRL
jgi:hypothetical protein